MNGTATITYNMFKGFRPHELTITMNVLQGDIRRFAVNSRAEALAKCESLGVTIV